MNLISEFLFSSILYRVLILSRCEIDREESGLRRRESSSCFCRGEREQNNSKLASTVGSCSAGRLSQVSLSWLQGCCKEESKQDGITEGAGMPGEYSHLSQSNPEKQPCSASFEKNWRKNCLKASVVTNPFSLNRSI